MTCNSTFHHTALCAQRSRRARLFHEVVKMPATAWIRVTPYQTVSYDEETWVRAILDPEEQSTRITTRLADKLELYCWGQESISSPKCREPWEAEKWTAEIVMWFRDHTCITVSTQVCDQGSRFAIPPVLPEEVRHRISKSHGHRLADSGVLSSNVLGVDVIIGQDYCNKFFSVGDSAAFTVEQDLEAYPSRVGLILMGEVAADIRPDEDEEPQELDWDSPNMSFDSSSSDIIPDSQ